MAEARVRTTVTLPAELAERLKQAVPPRQRSAFIAEAVASMLARIERREALRASFGVCKSEDYPHWRTPDDVQRYMDEMRGPKAWRRLSDEGT